MKKMLVLMGLILIVFSCGKEEQGPMPVNESGSSLKSASTSVTTPMKVNFTGYTNQELPPVQCMPEAYGEVYLGGGGWVCGTATHVGKVQKENSPYTVQGCTFGPAPGQVTELLSGIITAANGDFFYYTGYAVITFADGSIEGQITMNSGSGRFEDCQGSVDIVGSVDFVTYVASWRGEGTVTFN